MFPDLTSSEAISRIAQSYNCWVCVTDGARGVWYTGTNQVKHIPAISIRPRDTLGAGDVWHGAFALSLAEGFKEVDAIHFANAAAAYKCTTHGGRAGAPTRDQLNKFIKEKVV